MMRMLDERWDLSFLCMYKQPLAELGRFTGTPSHLTYFLRPSPTINTFKNKGIASHQIKPVIEINPQAATENQNRRPIDHKNGSACIHSSRWWETPNILIVLYMRKNLTIDCTIYELCTKYVLTLGTCCSWRPSGRTSSTGSRRRGCRPGCASGRRTVAGAPSCPPSSWPPACPPRRLQLTTPHGHYRLLLVHHHPWSRCWTAPRRRTTTIGRHARCAGLGHGRASRHRWFQFQQWPWSCRSWEWRKRAARASSPQRACDSSPWLSSAGYFCAAVPGAETS